MLATNYLVLLTFPALLAVAAVSDLMTMTISNRLCLLLVATFPVAVLMAGLPLSDIGWHVLAGSATLALGIAVFAMGWAGGGDAKLAACIGLWIGPSQMLPWGLQAVLYGGILTLIILAVRRMPLPATLAGETWIARLHHDKTGVPYGIALAASAMLVYPESPIALGLLGL